jgi:hypothetical protein
MSIKNLYPTVQPSLSLDFANTKQLDPRITFTRTTTATYYDGKTVAKAEENLLRQSQEFNTTWTAVRSTITANTTTAPDGTSTADSFIEDSTASNNHAITQTLTLTANSTYAVSVYAKQNGRGYITLSLRSSGASNYSSATFNLSTGAVEFSSAVGTGGAVVSTSIAEIPSGSGWYRCVLVAQAGTTISSPTLAIGLSDGSAVGTSGLPSYTGDGTSGIYIWGAQLAQADNALSYVATTTTPAPAVYQPKLLTAAAGQARFDHNPVTGESLGLLIEEQRSNLLTYSEQFDNADWTKNNSSISPNVAIAPDGTLSADQFIVTTGGNIWAIRGGYSVGTNNTTATVSIYLKKTTSQYVRLASTSSGTTNFRFQCTVDLDSGTITQADAFGSDGIYVASSVTPVGNGWYRVSVSGSITSVSNYRMAVCFPTSSTNTNNTTTGECLIWGAQAEIGAFPTSYIKTEGSSVTRNADAASMTGANFSSWYRADEGTLYAEAAMALGFTSSSAVAEISDSTSSNRISPACRLAGVSGTPGFVSYNGTIQTSFGNFTFASNNKTVLTYKTNDFAGTVNGGSVTTDASGNIPVVSTLRFGFNTGTGTSNCYIKKVAYYPSRLSNANLQALTTN